MKTIREWADQLKGTSVYNDFVELCKENHMDATKLVSNYEVLNAIVEWRGGLASGFEVRCVVRDVYGIRLGNDY